MDAVLESQRALVESAQQTSDVSALLFYFAAFIVCTCFILVGLQVYSAHRHQKAADERERRGELRITELTNKLETLQDWVRGAYAANQVVIQQSSDVIKQFASTSAEQIKALANQERSNRELAKAVAKLMTGMSEILTKESATQEQIELLPCHLAAKLKDHEAKIQDYRSGHP